MYRLASALLTQQIPRVAPRKPEVGRSVVSRRYLTRSASSYNSVEVTMDSTCFWIEQVPLFFVDNRLIERSQGLTRRWHKPARPERGPLVRWDRPHPQDKSGHGARCTRDGAGMGRQLPAPVETAYHVVLGKLRQMPRHYPIERPGRHGNESLFRRHGLAPVCWFRLDIGSMFFLC
jgi:hypothetical protein